MNNGKPKICLIYTGGTIGMTRLKNGILRPPDNPKVFLKVAPELKSIVHFDFVPLMNKDSTNMNPGDWTKIATAIYDRRNIGYKGFVVAHGTDTMHFSASAVAFALGNNLNFPVVFTGAQTIPAIQHGDARVNLLRACKVATMNLAEVVIAFGEYVFRGCRAQKKDERRFDAFESPAFPPVAYITEEIVLSPWVIKRSENRPDIELNADFEQGILQVSLIPGLEPNLLKPILESDMCKGVILQSFGAGNVPNEKPYSFTEIIAEAKKLNKPLIITSQFPANATLHTSYEPGRKAIEAGAIPTGNMTSACAAAKFRWVLAQVEKDIQNGTINNKDKIKQVNKRMQEVYIEEMDKPTNVI
ncbi:asparaginase [Candidatus Sumerlaeota bacterium]|nr:asparaginase [Candidatus Sumerlaeota bacterium]